MKEEDLKNRLKEIKKEQLEEIIFKTYKKISLKLDKNYKERKEFKEKGMNICLQDVEEEIKNYTFVLSTIEKYIKEDKQC